MSQTSKEAQALIKMERFALSTIEVLVRCTNESELVEEVGDGQGI